MVELGARQYIEAVLDNLEIGSFFDTAQLVLLKQFFLRISSNSVKSNLVLTDCELFLREVDV